jgi:hypothetical protein
MGVGGVVGVFVGHHCHELHDEFLELLFREQEAVIFVGAGEGEGDEYVFG